MGSITHQDIVDRLEALATEQSEAYLKESARIDKERESLREACGGIGHVYRNGDLHTLVLARFSKNLRQCVFCGAIKRSEAAD